MARRGEIVGAVDFGSRQVRVLIARKDDDGTIQILGHGTAPGRGCVSQGVIQDLNAAQVALKRALGDAEKEARVKVQSLFVGVNGKNVETFIREGQVKVETEMVELAHMQEALDIASRELLAPGKRPITSITAQEWYVDDLRVIDPINIRGGVLKTRVHFARLPTVIEDNIATVIDSQGRELEDLIFMPLAAALGCLTPEDMELGVGVLDMGRSTTGLAVYRDYRILGTQCFEWGGYHITRDVAAGLQVSFEEAEELILEYGIADALIREEADEEDERDSPVQRGENGRTTAPIKLKSAVRGAPVIIERSDLDEIVFERSKELMIKVRQYLHSRGLAKNLVRGLVLTGGASSIGNQAALAEAIFQVPSRVGMPDGVAALPPSVNAPEFVSAVGVVRHGFEYRAAIKSGRINTRGPVGSALQSMKRAFSRYFF